MKDRVLFGTEIVWIRMVRLQSMSLPTQFHWPGCAARGRGLMTGRTGGGGLAISLPGVLVLLLAMLLMARLAACGGGDSSNDGGEGDSPRATEAVLDASTDEPEATDEAEPEPTGQGILGRAGSQPTDGSGSTEEANDAASKLSGTVDSDTAKIESPPSAPGIGTTAG